MQGGDDDELALVQGVGQLRAVLVNLFHHTLLVVELVDGVLQLRVQHPAVGNHNHAVVHLLVVGIVQGRKTVRQPANGVGFARTRRMLHQIGLPHALGQSGLQQLVHRIPLVVAWKQKRCIEPLLALGILGLRHFHRQKLAHHGQPSIALEHLMPQVAGGIAQGIIGRVARTSATHTIRVATVERQKPRGGTGQPGGHPHLVGAHGKVNQGTVAKRQQGLGLPGGLIHRVAVVLVLAHRVFNVLRGVGFQLDGGQRQAIQEQH